MTEINCINCKHWTDENVTISCELGFLHSSNIIHECDYYKEKTKDGKKYDTNKNRMGLMCENFSNALWEVAKISTFGCSKYGQNTWQKLDNPIDRYTDALCRHLFQHLQGKKIDKESGLLHLSHLLWNGLALLEFELKGINKSENKVNDRQYNNRKILEVLTKKVEKHPELRFQQILWNLKITDHSDRFHEEPHVTLDRIMKENENA